MGEVFQVLGVVFALVLVGLGAGYFGFILLQAFRAKLLGRPGAARDELEDLRERVAELEEQAAGGLDLQAEQRLLEVEERVDFAERLLASERERAVLPEPSDEVSAPSRRGQGVQ